MAIKTLKLYGAEFQSESLSALLIRWETKQSWHEKGLEIEGSVLLEFTFDSEKIDYLVTIHGSGPYTVFFFDAKGILQTIPQKHNLSTFPVIRVQSTYVLLQSMQHRTTSKVPDIMYLKIED